MSFFYRFKNMSDFHTEGSFNQDYETTALKFLQQ